jgi:protein-tyrosine phosphatase
VIQLSVGVPEEAVIADYLSSNEARAVENETFLTTLAAKGVLAELVEPLFVVREDYIRAFLSTVDDDWGSINGYVRRALGLQEHEVDALCQRLLDC